MRLAAIYIYENSLPHIFGENHKELTINFGGEYIYEFTQNRFRDLIQIKKDKNQNYMKSFFGKNIELVSAIVGANGAGKTTIIDLIKNYKDQWIIEEDNNNQLVIYYTPFIRIENNNFENIGDISKYIMMERDADYERIGFSEVFQFHNSEKTKRIIRFMERDDITSILSHTSLPHFNKITITTNYLKEDHYQTSNKFRQFFDRFDALENIERDKRIKTEIQGGRLNLELKIVRSVIHKVHSILENSGNKYLSEGYMNKNLNADSPVFSNITSIKDAFYYFLDNAGSSVKLVEFLYLSK